MPDPCLAPSARIDLQLTGAERALTADPLLSQLYGNVFQNASDGVYVPGLTELSGAAFPVGMPDGSMVVYNPASGVAWLFRYNAGSSATLKWEFIGGAPLFQAIEGAVTLTPNGGNNWTDISGAGPVLNVPFQGVYRVRFGGRVNPAQNAQTAQIGLAVGAGQTPSDSATVSNGNVNTVTVAREIEVGSIPANTALRLDYRDASSSGTSNFQTRWISVVPVRCSN